MKDFLLKAACAAFFFAAPGMVLALGPQECVILVNRQSGRSMELANVYADLRNIPPVNVIHLDLPARFLEADATLTPEEFREFIYDPAMKALVERQLANHVLAWLYSLDFPAVISTTPAMSLTGLTFTRGQPPDEKLIQNGLWLSPLFSGPDRAGGPASVSVSLEQFTVRLTTNMPLPSMMLGWSGSRGMTLPEIKDHLRRSASADGSQPSASILFETIPDVRSTTRQWQFEPVGKELEKAGIRTFVSSNLPRNRVDLMGVMAGRAVLAPGDYGKPGPGAYADHLTSFGAVFHGSEQTKVTEWLRAGAAGTSGTVTEPGSLDVPTMLWAKFPSARFFVHYAAGCTLMESFYQATRSPLQILPIGDALCSPWAKPPGISLISLAEDEEAAIKGGAEFMASTWGQPGLVPPATLFMIDGRPVSQPGNVPQLTFDSSRLSDGFHEIRVVAYGRDAVRHQGMAAKGMITRNRNRSVNLSGPTHGAKVDFFRPIPFHVQAEGEPLEAAIVAQERVLAQGIYSNDMVLAVDPATVGAGPVSFQAVAAYKDGEPVRSSPLPLEIASLNQPPVIPAVSVLTNAEGEITLDMSARDEDGDPVSSMWLVDLMSLHPPPTLSGIGHASPAGDGKEGWIFSASNAIRQAMCRVDEPNRIKEARTLFQFVDAGSIDREHQAGLVFNYRDDQNYLRWGADGQLGAWVFLRVRDGRTERILSRGTALEARRAYTLAVSQLAAQKMGLYVDDELVAVADASFAPGEVGLVAGKQSVHYKHLLVSPPQAARSHFMMRQESLWVPRKHQDTLSSLFAGANDGHAMVLQKVSSPAEN